MGIKMGFDATVAIDGGTIKTIGDLTLDTSVSEHEVKTRASQDTRYIPGFKAASIELTVMAGADPDDNSGVDGYALLQAAFAARSPVQVTYTSAGGYSYSKKMIVTKFAAADPVDGVATASVSLKPSAIDSASGSGSGSGT